MNLFLYSLYRTAQRIHKIIPLRGGPAGAVAGWVLLLSMLPVVASFGLWFSSETLSRKHRDGLRFFLALLLLVLFGALHGWIEKRILRVARHFETRPESDTLVRIVLSNTVLVIYVLALKFYVAWLYPN